MSKRLDLTGKKFNKLLVVEFVYVKNEKTYWKCLCGCGNIKTVKGSSLRNSNTKSCGCLKIEPMSEETKRKISEKMKGENHPNYGKKRSEETIKRMSLSLKGIPAWNKNKKCPQLAGKNNSFYGKHHTDETRKKISKNRMGRCCGENNNNWNPNITDEERQDKRYYFKYYKWRKDIYERDNFSCQKCNKWGCNLQAHHIESYNNNPDLRTTISNGITFCKECHLDFHHQYGYGNNTIDQLNKFLYKEIGL